MTPETKKLLQDAKDALETAKDAVGYAVKSRAAREALLLAAREVEQARINELGRAEQFLVRAKATAWIEEHAGEDAECVRAGKDWPRLAQLRLGKKSAGSYVRSCSFEWNALGREVRRQLKEKA